MDAKEIRDIVNSDRHLLHESECNRLFGGILEILTESQDTKELLYELSKLCEIAPEPPYQWMKFQYALDSNSELREAYMTSSIFHNTVKCFSQIEKTEDILIALLHISRLIEGSNEDDFSSEQCSK